MDFTYKNTANIDIDLVSILKYKQFKEMEKVILLDI